MSAKPGTLPRWADVSLDLVEPSSGKQDQGFIGGEQPPAQYFNWLFNLIYQWMQYLNAPDDLIIGAAKLATEANAVAARITVAPAAEATAQYVCLAALGDARIWVGSSTRLALVITYNATRSTNNTDTWLKITNSQPATALYIARDRVRIGTMPLAQNTAWADAFVDGEGTTAGWGSQLRYMADTESETNADSDFPDRTIQAPTTAGTERKCLLHINRTSGIGDLRVYYSVTSSNTDSNSLEIVWNASWSNATNLWTPDLNTTCKKLMISKLGINVRHKNSGTATFDDASWDRTQMDWVWATTSNAGAGDENLLEFSNGRFKFNNTGSAQANDSNPPFNTSQANIVSPRNCSKVEAVFVTLGGADGNITPLEGLNLSSAADAISQAGDLITVKFGAAMQSANYCPVITPQFSGTTDLFAAVIQTKSTTQITFRIFRTTTGGTTSVADLNTLTIGVNLIIFGRQDT
jgi:hypothetical protein